MLTRIDQADAIIDECTARISELLDPHEAAVSLLVGITGVGRRVAEVILAEIGTDMSRFPTAGHLSSWAGMCPGNNESAGKHKGAKARRGNVHLKTALVTAATSASRTKSGYLKDKYHRLRARRGGLRAAVAIGHKILTAAFHMLSEDAPYRELGATYLDLVDRDRVARNLTRRLERLGYAVDLKATESQENASPFS